MLVFGRYKDQSFMIGDDIEIMITNIEYDYKGDLKVKVGIIAPRSIKVHRKEVYDAIQRGEEKKPSK